VNKGEFNPVISETRIQELIRRREYGHAQELLDEQIQKKRNLAENHYLLGVVCHFKGDLRRAAFHLKQALEHDPSHTDAAICLSVLYNDVGKYDQAKSVFEQANYSVVHKQTSQKIGINKKFAVKHLEIADLYFRYRRYDEAIDEYTKAANLDPTTLQVFIRRAKAFAKRGFVSRAQSELELLKREHHEFIEARVQLGLLHFSQGNLLDAELEWESALRLSPKNEELHQYLEMVRAKRCTH